LYKNVCSYEPFLRKLESIFEYQIHHNFYGKAGGVARRVPAVEMKEQRAAVKAVGPKDYIKTADFNLESSFKGHTVNALVLTGDEGRDQLR
jgi:hypothetical protein